MSDARLRELERQASADGAVSSELARARHRAGQCPWCGEGLESQGANPNPLWNASVGPPTCCCTPCYTDHPQGPWESAGMVVRGVVVCAGCPLTPAVVAANPGERPYPCPGPVLRVNDYRHGVRPWSPLYPPRRPE